MSTEFDYGTGRRKTATARTRLYAGSGNIEINGRAGLLTRDARKKERKKYGQRAARARYQYSKR